MSRARVLAGLSILASGATLAWSLTLPTVTFKRLGAAPETYSIFGGVQSLWEDGNWFLATIVFLFSSVFPVAKLIGLGWIWLGRGSRARHVQALHWLRLLGKWSMLDVFVVAAFVGAIRLGILAEGSSQVGIHVFAAAILMSMVSTMIVDRMDAAGAPRPPLVVPGPPYWWPRLLTTVSSVVVGAALVMPLLQIKKSFMWRNEVSLPGTTWRMAGDGELLLGAMLGLFVIGSSALRALLLMRVRWFRGGSQLVLKSAILLDEWAMLDVFGLGLVIVYTKLSELATTTMLTGFWILVAASILAQLDAWVFRRQVLRHEPVQPGSPERDVEAFEPRPRSSP